MFSYIIQSILAFVAITLTAAYVLSRCRYVYWKRRNVPYEEPTMLVGNLTFLMRTSLWEFLYKLGKKYRGDYYGIFLGWKPALVVQSPALAKRILLKDTEHFQDRYLYSGYEADPLGVLNLFNVKNPIWTQMRHELSPMFTTMRLKILSELMNINSEQLVQRIQRDYVDNKKPVDLKNGFKRSRTMLNRQKDSIFVADSESELFSMYTSDTVAYTVFGLRVSALSDADSPLWFITRHMVKWTFWRGLEFTMIFLLPYVATLLRLKFFSQPATEYIKQVFNDVVEQRKITGKSNDKDLVNHMLQLKENLRLPADANSELADNLMLAQAAVFILGAIETSSTTLSYCLHELAHHQDEQEILFEEIHNALKTSDQDILQYADLVELKYLTACINETLRKYPPVPYLDRLCNKTFKVDENLTIEEGVPVMVNVVGIHYNEEYYSEPEQWRPERMSNLTENDNMRFTFLPFGDGPRFCLGKRYGMLQIRTALAQMVARYRFEPCDDEPYDVKPDPYSLVLGPISGGKVKFIPR